jgi:hypothetical protein
MTEDVRRHRCGNCKWWDGDNTTGTGPPSYDRTNSGPCRRHAPQQLAPDALVQTSSPLVQVQGKTHEPDLIAKTHDSNLYAVPDDRDVEHGCHRHTCARDWCGEWAQASAVDDWEEVDTGGPQR